MITREELLKRKRITNVSFSISFDPIPRIEKYMYELERRLKKQFPDELVDTKVPYDFVPDAPRFMLRHARKKRFLEVSLVRATLKMPIVDDYSRNIQQGLDFFKSQVKAVFNIIKTTIDPSFHIMGGSFRIEYSTLDIPEISTETFFCERFLKDNIPPPFKFESKLTYVVDRKYFVNYNLSGFKKIEGQIDLKSMTPGKQKFVRVDLNKSEEFDVVDKGITVNFDINDRYVLDGLNPTVKEVEPSSSIDDIFEIAKDKINGLEDFLL